jgi:NADH:ubiquinone oxidoreductase subunit F (NADH-binding)
MTETLMRAPSSTRRLLGPAPELPLPRLDARQLVELVERAGLTGRGGAGFPTARKLMSVSGHRPVVLGNAMEGEPLSSKDAVLLHQAPGLVIDGLTLVGVALGAKRLVLATGPEVPSGPAEQVAQGTQVEVLPLTGGFVAGQESALVNQVNGRLGVPSDPLVPVFRRGVDGRPTVVLNAETLAQLALLARYGADWFRAEGTAADPGTFLATLSGSSSTIVRHPGVLEAPRGAPLRSLLVAAGTDLDRVESVLVGGYHGAWVPGSRLDTPMSSGELSRYGATPGAGVVHVLDRDFCPLAVSAQIATYLAGEGARQCGPCVNGLPRMAETLTELSRPETAAGTVAEVERLRRLIDGRGACAHPAGTMRFVTSTMTVFATHVEEHLGGECRARARRLDPL